MREFIVSGTDTDVGKTVASSLLVLGLKAHYWKPMQSGLEGGTDSETVAALAPHDDLVIYPESYRLQMPASPHLSAEAEGVEISIAKMDRDLASVRSEAKDVGAPLLIEGAGGLMVPVTRECLYIDLFAKWQIPVVLVVRAGLGTLNHTLLSLEAMRSRDVPIHGLIMMGDGHPDNAYTLETLGKVKILGHIPKLDQVNAQTLKNQFDTGFSRSDFLEG